MLRRTVATRGTITLRRTITRRCSVATRGTITLGRTVTTRSSVTLGGAITLRSTIALRATGRPAAGTLRAARAARSIVPGRSVGTFSHR
jgi:hypothetical protein